MSKYQVVIHGDYGPDYGLFFVGKYDTYEEAERAAITEARRTAWLVFGYAAVVPPEGAEFATKIDPKKIWPDYDKESWGLFIRHDLYDKPVTLDSNEAEEYYNTMYSQHNV